MLAVKKSRNRRLACPPASAISFGTSIADAAAGRTISVGTMIASAWLDPTASAWTDSSILIPMSLPPVFLFSLLGLGSGYVQKVVTSGNDPGAGVSSENDYLSWTVLPAQYLIENTHLSLEMIG